MFGILKSSMKSIVAGCIQNSATRPLINFGYNALNLEGKKMVHRRFRTLFYKRSFPKKQVFWELKHNGWGCRMPLRSDSIALEWETAISVIGHGIDIKETYWNFLSSKSHRPTHFIDVGANYGTHSLIFATHGVPVLSFEPNPSCHDYFNDIHDMNSVQPDLQKVALGAEAGQAVLAFPEGETWLGSLSYDIDHKEEVRRINVDIVTLDSFKEHVNSGNVILKIDAEGFELNVLNGARNLIEDLAPYILFESKAEAERKTLSVFFESVGYEVHALPFNPDRVSKCLTFSDFEKSENGDYIALPASGS